MCGLLQRKRSWTPWGIIKVVTFNKNSDFRQKEQSTETKWINMIYRNTHDALHFLTNKQPDDKITWQQNYTRGTQRTWFVHATCILIYRRVTHTYSTIPSTIQQTFNKKEKRTQRTVRLANKLRTRAILFSLLHFTNATLTVELFVVSFSISCI